jgi:hypothetical protein
MDGTPNTLFHVDMTRLVLCRAAGQWMIDRRWNLYLVFTRILAPEPGAGVDATVPRHVGRLR